MTHIPEEFMGRLRTASRALGEAAIALTELSASGKIPHLEQLENAYKLFKERERDFEAAWADLPKI